MVDLKNVKVDFPPNSAYAVLLGLVLNCGIDSVLSALGEIAAQQGVQADGATPRAYCKVHETYYDVSMGCAACPPRR